MYYLFLTLNNSKFCPEAVFTGFVYLAAQTDFFGRDMACFPGGRNQILMSFVLQRANMLIRLGAMYDS